MPSRFRRHDFRLRNIELSAAAARHQFRSIAKIKYFVLEILTDRQAARPSEACAYEIAKCCIHCGFMIAAALSVQAHVEQRLEDVSFILPVHLTKLAKLVTQVKNVIGKMQDHVSLAESCSTRLRSATEIMCNGAFKTSRFVFQCFQRSLRSWLPQRNMQLRNATSRISRQCMLNAGLRSAFEMILNGVLMISRFFPQCRQQIWRSWLPQ